MKASEYGKKMTAGTVISAPAAVTSKKSGAAAFAEKNRTNNSPKVTVPVISEEERRAQLVEVTDTSVPDAKPVVMTMGEYEDLVAKEKAEYEAKVSAEVAENSRLRAMSVHENQQHGAELADKRMQEFSSRYKMFTPKEERMHGDEVAPKLESAQPAIAGAAREMISRGDYDGARALLEQGYEDGLYGRDVLQLALAEMIENNTITPETRLAGLEKVVGRQAQALDDLGSARTAGDVQGAKEAEKRYQATLGSQAQYEKMLKKQKERIATGAGVQKKKDTEEQRDRVFSSDLTEVDAYIRELEGDGVSLRATADAAKKRAGETYGEHLANTEYGAETSYTAATEAWRNAEDAIKQNEAELYYANGIRSFAQLSDAEKEMLLRYVAMQRRVDMFNTGTYGDFYGERRRVAEDEAEAERVCKAIKGKLSKDDFARMEETLGALYNALRGADVEIATAKFANEYPIMGSTVSIFANLIGGVTSVAGIAAQGLANIGKAKGYVKPIDVNSAGFAPTKVANVIRGTVAGNIEREVGGTGGKVASFLYQTGMSGVDSLAASFTGNRGGALLLGTSSASNAFLDAKERGASDSQAIWTGLFAGVFETLFERVSIGNLNALKETPVGTVKDILKNVGKSALVNATEEGLTEAATAISDYLINGDFSTYGAMYKDLVAEGVSPEAAKAQVKKAFWQQNLVAAAGGALMGIGFAGGTGTLNYATGRSANTDLGTMYKNADGTYNTEAVQALIAEGIASENGEIARYAANIRTAIEQGKSVDVKQLGALQRALAAEQSADAPAVAPMDTEVQTAPATTGAPVNVMSDTALAGMMGVSRGNVLVPNGDGTNSLITVEEAERRKAAQAAEADAAGASAPVATQSGVPTENAASASGISERDAKTLDAISRSTAAIGANDPQVRLVGMLSGNISNATADRIANTPALAKAFSELAGVELTGSVAQQRRTIKEKAAAVSETFRIEQKAKTARVIESAGYQNSAEPMIGEGGALGAYGKAAYKAMQQRGTDAYVRGGLGAAAVKHYNAEFGAYYKQGFSGVGFSYNDTRMSEADARAAYEAGIHDAAIADAATLTEKSGILYGASKKDIDTALRLAKVFGKDVIFINRLGSDNFGGCYTDDGNIYLQAGAKNPIVQIVAHEFVHSLESKKLYKDLRDFVFAELKRGGKTEAQLRAEIRKNSAYRDMEDPDVDKEIVARFVAEHLLTDEDTIRRIVQAEGKTFAQKLHDLWNALIAKAKSAFGVKTDPDVQRQLDVIERGRALLAEVIKSEEVASDGGVRYAYDYTKTFAEQLDDWEKGLIPKDDTLLVGKTPKILQQIGFSALPVTINQTHVDYAINNTKDTDHYITKNVLSQLPQALENPVAVIRSQSTPSRVAVILLLKNPHNGKQVIVPIEVDGSGWQNTIRIDSNAITSVLGKTNALSQMKDAIETDSNNDIKLFYWNKKEAISLLRSAGHQLSGSSPQDGFIHSIRDKGSKVKWKFNDVTETKQFMRWFGDWKKNPKRASKVVNEDGTPKIVYHGTNVDIEVFKSADGTFWFSENEDYAEAMATERGGDIIIPVYLNMRNPFRAKLEPGKFSDPTFEKPIIAEARRRGCDGVIIECDTTNDLEAETYYIVFDATQIKHAEENVGTFDRNEPKFRYSFTEDGTQGEVENFLNEQDANAAEDEFLLKMLHYQENPDEATEVILENELGGKENFIDRAIHTKTDEALRREAEKAAKGKARREIVTKRLAKEYAKSVSWFQRKFVDSGYAVTQIGKQIEDSRLYAYYNAARASTNAAVYMLTGTQTDVDGKVVGEGLNAIFAPIKEKGEDYYHDFQKYLYHLHNADRMSRQNDERTEEAKVRFAVFKSEHPELDKYAEYQIERIAESEIDMPEREAAAEYIRLRDEMRREENMRNKPIFGHEVDAGHSLTASLALERLHPEFKEHRDKVYKYIENLLQYRVDSGLITAEDMEQLKGIYPHYVPTYRVTDPDARGKQRKNRNVTVGKAIGRAIGGDEALMPLDQALAKLTMRVVREGSKNQFGRRLMYNGAVKLKDHIKNVTEYKPQGQTDAFANADAVDADVDPAFRKTNTFVVHDGGQMWEMEIGDALYEAVQALSPTVEEMSAAEQFVRAANKLYKELITGKNPFFMVKNFERDLQDAGMYTKDLKGFAKAYPRAWKEMTTNGELWQQYQALGGLYSSFFDYKTGMAEKPNKKGLGKISEKIEAANMLIEQAPRFAEFISTIERGGTSHDNLMTAMHNAADVTVNFGRSGTWGKYLNETIIPFFNPGVQGLDKTVRMLTDNRGAREWIRLVAKALLLGIAPSVINALAAALFDWDEWEDIKDRDKDTYYLIRIGDGKYVKIPKGRVTAALSMTAARVYDVASGEEVNFGEYLSAMSDQIAPANPFESNVVMPWVQTALFDPENPGKTWYGGDIESQRLRNYAPSERYDEKTDIVSRWIGKVTGLSPKKINYLFDSYTGVVGDILLPALVPNKNGFDAVGKVLEKTFVLDSVSTNRLNNDFYTMLDSVTYNKNSPEATAMDKLLYRYMNKRSQAVSEVNAAIKKIESDPNLSNKERAELLRAQQTLRNTVEKNAMDQISEFYRQAEYYYQHSPAGDEEEKIDYAYLYANKWVFGAEYAIETYNKSTYKKAQECHAEGVSYDDFFKYYFQAKRITLTGTEATNEKRSILIRMQTDEDTKISLYRAYISDSRDDDIRDFSDAGLDFDDFLRVQNQYATIDAQYDTAKEKTQAFTNWVKKQKFTKKQNVVVLDCFKYFIHIPQ